MAKGTLIAAMNMGRAAEDEFNDWYDTEHLPERQRVPGFLACQRWIGATDRKVSVATYDLDSVKVLQSPGYLAIGGANLSPWSKRVTAQVERLHALRGRSDPARGPAPARQRRGLLLNAMNVVPGVRGRVQQSGTTRSTFRRSPPCRACCVLVASAAAVATGSTWRSIT